MGKNPKIWRGDIESVTEEDYILYSFTPCRNGIRHFRIPISHFSAPLKEGDVVQCRINNSQDLELTSQSGLDIAEKIRYTAQYPLDKKVFNLLVERFGVPLTPEIRAYAIVSYSPDLIKLIGALPGTERIYFEYFRLKCPEGSTPGHVAEILAGATNSRVVENLNLSRQYVFTSSVKKAARYNQIDIAEEVERLRGATDNSSFKAEALDEEYIPF